MAKDAWIERGEGDRLDSLGAAVEHLGAVVLKFCETLAARRAKSSPSPSDAPAPPGEDYEAQVRAAEERMRRHFHGSRAALRRAAEGLVKSRRAGTLDGARMFHDEGGGSGGRVDGRPVPPAAGKKARPL